MTKKLVLILLLLSTISCTHLSRSEREDLEEMKSLGIREDSADQVANPGVAAVLNFLPGFGNFYLASGNGGDSAHYIYGTLNLISWPVSVIWGVPEAMIDANTINKRELIYYYKYNKKGKAQLEKLKK